MSEKDDNMLKLITTHSNSFHCDEVAAIALLKVFTSDTYGINRVPHKAILPFADFTIDIGRQYDPSKGLFDHHQWEGGKSSAGLIWDYLDVADKYPKISAIIKLIDQNDVGDRKSTSFELPAIVSSFNTDDIYNDAKQLTAFYNAVSMLVTYFKSMKTYQDNIDITIKEIASLTPLNDILILPHYLVGWADIIHGKNYPNIRAVAWPKLDNTQEWCAQTITEKPGTYNKNKEKFTPDDSMIFVHSNGFFCVAKNEQTMMTYLLM